MRTQIVQPPADTRVLLGLTASLQCKVSSDPSVPYNVDWYRDGQVTPIINSQRVGVQADGTLEIQAVRASDVGVYSCMVKFPVYSQLEDFVFFLHRLDFIMKLLFVCCSKQNRLHHQVEMKHDLLDFLLLSCHSLQQM